MSFTFLLPERRRFAGQAPSPALACALGRADRPFDAEPGERAQLLRCFSVDPVGWPLAAISREAAAGDAGASQWLRADPVFARPDINGVRLMAWGNLQLTAEDADDFLQALRPIFDEAGIAAHATSPERWHLRLPASAAPPPTTDPDQALGTDLLAHLPEGPEGRPWRVLLNDVQVTLHNHPRNARRVAAGLPPVNSIWPWGGGVLPGRVACLATTVRSTDADLLALAGLAGAVTTGTGRFELESLRPGEQRLIDLRAERDWSAIESCFLLPALAVSPGQMLLDFSDGARFRIAARQAWRFWRRPLTRIDA